MLNKVLVKNFTYLLLGKAINIVSPLIILPYLLRTVDPEGFGVASYVITIIGYFVLFSELGLDFFGPREIAINKNEQSFVLKFILSVLSIRFTFSLLSTVIIVLLYLSNVLHGPIELYLFSLVILFGNIFQLNWALIGLESFKSITFVNSLNKISTLIFTYLFIKNTDDFYLIPLFEGIGFLCAGFASLIIIFNKDFSSLSFPSSRDIKKVLLQSLPCILVRFVLSLYKNSGIVILGFVVGVKPVGLYVAAKKVIDIVIVGASMVNQVIFPQMSISFKDGREQHSIFMKKVFRYFVPFLLLCCGAAFIISLVLEDYVFVKGFKASGDLFRKMIPLVFIMGLSHFFSFQGYLARGKYNDFLKTVLPGSIIALPTYYIFCQNGQVNGLIMATILIESIVLMSLILGNRKLEQ